MSNQEGCAAKKAMTAKAWVLGRVTALLIGLLAVSLIFASKAFAQTTTSTTTTTPSSGSVLKLSSTGQIWFIAIIIVALALLLFGITLYDRISLNHLRDKYLAQLFPPEQHGGDPNTLTQAFTRPPRPVPGLTRALLALTLVTLVGIVLVVLLVGNSNNAGDLLKAVVTALTSALTVVLGFYFGAKTASDAATAAQTATNPTDMVSFDANKGMGMVAAQIGPRGSTVILPDGSGLTLQNSTFTGWNSAADGSGTHYNAGARYVLSGNVTLYADWK